MNNKKITVFFVLISILFLSVYAKSVYKLQSPDKNIKISVFVKEKLKISADYKNITILQPSLISMKLKQGVLGDKPIAVKIKRRYKKEILHPVVRIKEAEIENKYNELSIKFKNYYALIVRAYNSGFAYRFKTSISGKIIVLSESGIYEFSKNHMLWWGKEKTFESHNQVYFDYRSLRKTTKEDLASLPLIINPKEGPKVVITETDLFDYPGMWLRGTGENKLYRVSAKYPKKIIQKSDRYLPIKERENYIAKTDGTRNFPWRIFVIGNDSDLIKNQLTYLLAQDTKIKDTSWIKPGKVAWDWWNANNIYGVDFKSGINTKTYKYYIDFASKYGIENILLDEGWYKLGDLSAIVPEMDMKELLSYAKKKNVGIVLWCVWKTLDNQFESSLKQFQEWGIKGIKVDFMNRDDQQMVNFYHKVAREAAKYKLLVDFHGSYKPAGIRRMYPNVLTREGVNGGEQFKWSMRQTPEHDLILPFGRMLAGPMDYTPGAMHNAQAKDYKPIFDTPMSMGTRCHQLAMFVCYESPLQMLCDTPSNYYREPECMEYLSAVPTVWDKTIVLKAKVSDYLYIARKSGENWYIAGMTDWTERDFTLNLSFLPKNKNYNMTMYIDGINANMIATDFKMIKEKVNGKYRRKIHLAKGGGFAIMLKPVK